MSRNFQITDSFNVPLLHLNYLSTKLTANFMEIPTYEKAMYILIKKTLLGQMVIF